uniref:Uncharacterized protein n=1 Tax=Pseudomonas phage Pyxpy01 TaxID=3138546 RepID=A0AAU6VZF3_9VIRU
MSTTLLVTVRTSSHPFSVSTSTIEFTGMSSAQTAKAKIERELGEYNSGFNVTVTILEGTA